MLEGADEQAQMLRATLYMHNICLQQVLDVLRKNHLFNLHTFHVLNTRKPLTIVIHSEFNPRKWENLYELSYV
jgi:hypothetical protein